MALETKDRVEINTTNWTIKNFQTGGFFKANVAIKYGFGNHDKSLFKAKTEEIVSVPEGVELHIKADTILSDTPYYIEVAEL